MRNVSALVWFFMSSTTKSLYSGLSSMYSIAVSYSEILRCQSLVLLATSDQVLMKPQWMIALFLNWWRTAHCVFSILEGFLVFRGGKHLLSWQHFFAFQQQRTSIDGVDIAFHPQNHEWIEWVQNTKNISPATVTAIKYAYYIKIMHPVSVKNLRLEYSSIGYRCM